MIIELFASLSIISLISIFGIFIFYFKTEKIKNYLDLTVAFAAGALLGAVFLHLIPHIAEEGYSLNVAISILFGMVIFFVLEKVLHWHHCHKTEHKIKSLGYMSLLGDALHNFIDGMIIAGAFLTGNVVGFSTAFAVAMHEIPQEIGDIGVLLKSNFKRKKALFANFLISLTSFLGAIFVLSNVFSIPKIYFLGVAAGSFLYIAGTDFLPELKEESSTKKIILQLIFLLLGIIVIFLTGFLE